ncbi:MAG: hypothetical protein JKY54_18800 [Flavobacteriales bacterium]|nr:hypothetical protein [Flavobacteriales bacterium]
MGLCTLKKLLRTSLALVSILFVLSFSFSSCKKDKAEQLIITVCDTTSVSYSLEVAPIIFSNCLTGCHNSVDLSGTYAFENYAQIAANIDAIVCVINHDLSCAPMPKFAPKLADSSVLKITCWAENGANNN